MKKKKSKLPAILIVLIIVLAIIFLLVNSWYNNAIYSPANNENKDINLEVKEGDNFLNILSELKEKGLVKDENAVKVYLRLNSIPANIKAGKYTIASTVNIPELIEILESGAFKESVLVTIPEGMRYENVATLLDSKFNDIQDKNFNKEEFLNIVENPDNYNFKLELSTFISSVKPSDKSLEGLLFPDTYRFDSDSTSQIIIETMIANLQNKLEEENLITHSFKSNTPVNSIYKAIVLASIIEKEATNSTSYGPISGVFYNRLNQNYPLQSDATIVYITKKTDEIVLISDTKIQSPYNTYLNVGLPPTPINSPGIKSIKAAITPEENDYFYFLQDKDGNTYFAKTFAEHQANINAHL